MKKVNIAILAMLCTVVSCDEYDDTQMLERVDQIEEQQSALDQMITDLQVAKKELDSRLATNDTVVSVERFENVDDKSGYIITFLYSDPITLYDGEKGDKGVTGDDGEDAPQGQSGGDGVKGDDGDDGDDAVIYYVNYTTGDDTVTIRLYSSETAYVDYEFPLEGSATSAVPTAVAFTLGNANATAALDSSNNTISINLPSTLTEDQYGSIVVNLVSDDGSMGSSVVTRATSNWTITITEPTFDGTGAYENNAQITLTHTTAVATKGSIEVIFTTQDGLRSTSSIEFDYTL